MGFYSRVYEVYCITYLGIGAGRVKDQTTLTDGNIKNCSRGSRGEGEGSNETMDHD